MIFYGKSICWEGEEKKTYLIEIIVLGAVGVQFAECLIFFCLIFKVMILADIKKLI